MIQSVAIVNLLSFTGVAQRQRDGLITRRSQDRNLSPVFYISVGLQNLLVNASDAKQAPLTGVAQRQRARLITLRLTGSTPVAGILHFGRFAEPTRLSLVTLHPPVYLGGV